MWSKGGIGWKICTLQAFSPQKDWFPHQYQNKPRPQKIIDQCSYYFGVIPSDFQEFVFLLFGNWFLKKQGAKWDIIIERYLKKNQSHIFFGSFYQTIWGLGAFNVDKPFQRTIISWIVSTAQW